MKKHKPKGPVPSLIGGANGKPRRVEVKQTSKCYRCKAELLAGTQCAAIPKLGTAHTTLKRVCDDCFDAILKKSEEDLNALKLL